MKRIRSACQDWSCVQRRRFICRCKHTVLHS